MSIGNDDFSLPPRTPTEDAAAWAGALRRAEEQRRPIAPLRARDPALKAGAAYDIQEINTCNTLARGHSLVGRKIGLTSEAVQRQLGIDEPDYGMLFSHMQIEDGGTLQLRELIQPKVEAEVALVLRADLADPALTQEQLVAAVDYAVAALEIVDSRIQNWDISLVDTIADNASSARFVLGRQHTPLAAFDPIGCAMKMYANDSLVSKGEGRLCLGSPVLSALWLAARMIAVGRPLRAGDIILTGALGPMVALTGNTAYRAEIDGLGSVAIAAR